MKQITEIKSVKLSLLNNYEYAQFIKSLEQLISTATADKLNIEAEVVQRLQEYSELFTEATRQTRASKETHSIKDLDKKRGQLVSFLLSSFRNERLNVVEERKEAASVLFGLTKNYTGISSLPVRSKTQVIAGLIKDLTKPTALTHVQTLGLHQSLTALETLNKEVEKLFFGRAESQVSNKLISTKEVRKQAGKTYKYISQVAFATNIIHPSTESQNFVELLNKLIDDTNTAQKHRASIASTKHTNKHHKTTTME